MPKLDSGRGYAAEAHVMPLVLMPTGGGRTPGDLRMLEGDTALTRLLERDAFGDWLRRTAAGSGLSGLAQVNQHIMAK